MANGDEVAQAQPITPEVRFDAPALEEISSFTPQQMQEFEDFLGSEELAAFQENKETFGLIDPEPGLELDTEPQSLETFTSSDIQPPEDMPEGVGNFDSDFSFDASSLPVPLTRDEIYSLDARNTEKIIEASRTASIDDTGNLKQRRPLNERNTLADHYDYSVKTDENGDVIVTTQTTGSVSNGNTVGKTEPATFKLDGRHVLNIGQQATLFAANYNQMSPTQQAIGSLQLFTNTIRPYFQTERDAQGNVTSGVPEAAFIANVVDSLSLYNQWGNLNGLDRFRRTANQLINLGDELGYGDKIPVQARNGLALLNFGYAAYNLLNNWNNMDAGQRTIGTLHVINQGAQAYQAGSAVLSAYQGSAAAGSAVAAGSATAAGTGSAAAAGSSTAAGAGTASAATSTGATGASAFASTALTWAGYVAAAYGAYSMVDQWGRGGNAQSRAVQSSNGAAIGAVFGPYGAIIGAAVGLAIGSINAGKSAPQMRRDALRKGFVKNNIFQRGEGSQIVVGLADGSVYDVGVDGSGSRALNADGTPKTFANPNRIAERDKAHVAEGNELRPYDIDYTNDLDYITSLATKAANLLPVGGTLARETSEVDQINGYLTNAATSNAGREMTKENFGKVMENVRGFYSDMGIDSLEEGMDIINDMRKNNRLSKDDYNAMVMGLDFAFNSDFERAQAFIASLDRDNVKSEETMEELEAQKTADIDELEAAQEAAEAEESI